MLKTNLEKQYVGLGNAYYICGYSQNSINPVKICFIFHCIFANHDKIDMWVVQVSKTIIYAIVLVYMKEKRRVLIDGKYLTCVTDVLISSLYFFNYVPLYYPLHQYVPILYRKYSNF
ncbi:hypothetical protein PHYBLDRAFT_170557 [Phycomyces blakesleeanus NRRL 1555(-)]|uniref:Uncharacterized protein n=1 Tax=Phycomyces blakesleeanus (strain ATCC 8743b / DSM 1359 / FGSC 10004 / NBRC 33097 / NRRL 1555) TaxID=763407 RepID=A0A167LVI0_PHYB8|nr:hypothetical protein PHYBLDRAFT_170557 [Phycomyces blakesleeanus NRRL 1555(-)]OAD71178.1 hypothetical protein PHYBLDRAFT_170557 [Phycomyces blakesleeanus NRRL 1555(-)]|eukprot:XP_018289218.1 hypothetical protein PHYBLDRAFT_170557 [Phycomyces blakesleeanus NRRL 1555(-)]